MAWRGSCECAVRALVIGSVFLLALVGLQAQTDTRFLLPPDEEIQELLRAIEAFQSGDGQSGGGDPAYLLRSLERLEARQSPGARSEIFRLSLPLLYFRINQNVRAVELLEVYSRENPRSARGQLLLAFGYLRLERYQQALAVAEQAVQRDSTSAYGHYLLGMSNLGLNQLESAERDFQQALSLDEAFAEPSYQLGLLYSRDPETMETSLEFLERALNQGMSTPEVLVRLGFVLNKLGRPEEAAAHLERARELKPEFIETYYLLAESYRKQGAMDDARAAMERFGALKQAEAEERERQSRATTAYEDAVTLLKSQGDHLEEAQTLLLKTVEVFPNFSQAFYRLAQINYLQKRTTQGIDFVRTAIRLNPLEAEYYYVLALCLQNGNPGEAVQSLRTAIALDRGVPDFHNLLGNLLFERGDYPGSVAAYREATILQPENPVFHLNLSAALERTGELEESRREKERYLELLKSKTP